ncbi:hypothetical protein FQA39_LY12983 [Lamprigera yunnana]|nr:hypothetical protein FQA39_LY12983 [Lamprigera yunnana]
MAASYAGIDLSLREEAFLYDQNSKTNFRFVVVDPKYDYNYTIMAGTEAMSDSEIVISQQYAFKNGYEIGDTIKIGASEPMIISGFGSDVLTYYPLVDPNFKIIVSKGNPNDFQFSTYYFMKDDNSKRNSLNLENKVAMYDSLLMNNKSSLNAMYESSKDQSISIDDIKSSNNIKHFEDTTFDLN